MPLSHRVERIAEQIREEVSQILATEVADPVSAWSRSRG